MKVSRRTDKGRVYFIVSDLDDKCRIAVKDLNFEETERGFAKSFLSTSPSLDRIFQRFALRAEEMILQTAGAVRPNWENALADLLRRIGDANVEWWLTGSAAMAIRNVGVVPRDIERVFREILSRHEKPFHFFTRSSLISHVRLKPSLL